MADHQLPHQLDPDPDAYDYTDPEQEKQRAAAGSLKDDRAREVEAAILSTPQGREWLWGVLSGLHVFEQRLAMTGSDRENDFYAGEREGGIRLMRRFARIAPQNFARMFVEQDRN